MTHRTSRYALVAAAVILLATSFAPALANRGPGTLGSFSGSWTISYFTVSGSTCTSTPWPAYFTDGTGIGGPGISPVVGTSQNICVQVSVTGDTTDAVGTNVYYQIPGIVSGTIIFAVLADGSGSGTIVVPGSSLDSLGLCMTAPEKISIGSASNNGPIADHLIRLGPDCNPTTGVPEFPLGSVGFVALTAAMIPVALLLRKRFIGSPLSTPAG